jgi:Undecaprenyl-phosphate glucose phosphotransferase
MLIRNRQLLATGIFLLDGASIAMAWLGSYALRFRFLDWPAPLGVPSFERHLWFGAVLTPVALLVLRSFELYRSARTARLSQELIALLQGVAIVTALAALASFATKGDLSRGVLAAFAVLAAALLCGSRIVIRSALHGLRRRGRNLRHVLIVGTGELARSVRHKMSEHRDYGLTVEGFVTTDAEEIGRTIDGVPVVGAISNLQELVESHGAEWVYVALPRSAWQAEREVLERLADSTAAVRLVPDLAYAFTLNASVEDFDGMPVVLLTESPWQGWNGVAKRGFDLAFAAAGLVLLAPLLLLIAAWVKLDSAGPALYRQERVGMNGRRFRMLKFRTMRVDAEAKGPGWSRPDDPRRTRAGEVLRRLSLDELPQLANVLAGHMSLVGPRPERPMYVDRFRATIPRYMLRHHMKAGITGWAQVNGLRGDTPLDARIQYDLYYVRHWSLAFDLRILALTLLRVFRDASAH